VRTPAPISLVLLAALAAGCVSASELAQKSAEADRYAGELSRERQRVAELATQLSREQAASAQQADEAERAAAVAAELSERLQDELAEARGQIARLQGQLAEATDQRETLARQLEITQRAASDTDVDLARVAREYDAMVRGLERQKVQLTERATQLSAELAATETRAAVLAAERDALAAERIRLDVRGRELRVELAAREADLAARTAELAAREADLARTRQSLEAATAELGSARQAVEVARADLAARQAEIEAAKAELTRTREALGETTAALAERDRKLAESTATYDRLVADLKGEIADGQVRITRLRDRLTVNLVDKVVFDSGSTAINATGQQVLRKVAGILRPITDKRVQIEGHTDDVPIAASSRARFPSNWELSVARATVVARFLEEQGGIDPARLVATGYGQHRPVAANATADGRAQNRRIEIVLVPAADPAAVR
jgi:chemotaxis protein MotB